MVLTGNSLVFCEVMTVSFIFVILLPGPFAISVLVVRSCFSRADSVKRVHKTTTFESGKVL